MNAQLIICLVIFCLTVISFCWGKISMGTTAVTAMLAFVLTGCLDPADAVSYFGNTSAILVMAMAIISAGFAKTQFVDKLAATVGKIANGSLMKITAGYVILTAILTQLVSSPTTVFCIVAPLAGATLDSLKLSRSKVMFSLGVTAITCCGILPFGAGISQVAKINTFLEAAGSTYVCNLTDMMKLRLPLMIIWIIYAIFVAPRFAPEQPELPIVAAKKVEKKEPMSDFHEKAALVIFFGTTLCLIFASLLGVKTYIIAMTGALLLVLTGVMKPKEASSSIPLWLYFLIVGSMAISAALVQTGAGDLIGSWIASIGGGTHNEYVLYLIFFLAPFIVTQFMQNNATIPVFIPIVIAACTAIGANPIGPCIIVYAGVLGSIMTPMATATVIQYMGEGGYTQASVLKMSAIPAILFTVVSVISAAIFFPLF